MKLFMRIAAACAVPVLLWLCVYVGERFLLSPKQRFMGECTDIYSEIDCWERWSREHPMPESYGREP